MSILSKDQQTLLSIEVTFTVNTDNWPVLEKYHVSLTGCFSTESKS